MVAQRTPVCRENGVGVLALGPRVISPTAWAVEEDPQHKPRAPEIWLTLSMCLLLQEPRCVCPFVCQCVHMCCVHRQTHVTASGPGH